MKKEPERIIGIGELAERLNITVKALDDWLMNPRDARGPLPPPRAVGTRNVGWPSSVVDRFIRKLPEIDMRPHYRKYKARAGKR